MASSVDYRTLRVRGMGMADVETQVVNVLAADGTLDVRRLGPGRLGVYRTYRPTWALVLTIVLLPAAGVGLLFLLVKKSEPGEVLIVDGPTGTHITIPPVVPGDLDAQIEARLNAGGPGPEASAPPPPPPSPPAGTDGLIGSVPGTNAEPVVPLPRLTDPPSTPTARVAAPAPANDDLDSATVRRSDLGSARRVTLRFDGQDVVVSAGEAVTFGRDPSSAQAERAVVVPGDAGTVSKTHATLRVDAGGAISLTDLGSTNGTTVERAGHSQAVAAGTWVDVAVGDVVTFGAVRAVVADG